MRGCIFCKVIEGQLSSVKRYEDKHILAINDINPARPVHVLFIPKKHFEVFEELDDDNVMSSIRKGIHQIVAEEGLVGKGYKIVVNGGGAQEINHLHFHLMGPIGLRAPIS